MFSAREYESLNRMYREELASIRGFHKILARSRRGLFFQRLEGGTLSPGPPVGKLKGGCPSAISKGAMLDLCSFPPADRDDVLRFRGGGHA